MLPDIQIAQKSKMKPIREIAKKEGMEIIDLITVRPSLEDAFVSIVKAKKTMNDKQ